MTVAKVRTIALVGLDARAVAVECVRGSGLPGLRLVGLPDAAVRESADRVRSALERSNCAWTQERVVVNLAPADLPKVGTGFDLPVAIAFLAATGQVPAESLQGLWAIGELGLDGSVRPVPGVLPAAAGARDWGALRMLVPARAASEAALVDGLTVIPVADLAEVLAILRREVTPLPAAPADHHGAPWPLDLADVRGQSVGKRALEIAAAGGHHVLFAGPPGCGKTMLARRLPRLLPPLSVDEALEVAAIQSVSGERDPGAALDLRPPLREPHHTTSAAALIGGGSGIPRPGEISLAHRGVLLMDELLETPRWILDAMRQPLERGEVVITRSRSRVRFPAKVLLIAATNPCPCGNFGSSARPCTCRPDQIERYRGRLSGPLLDRLDLQVELRPVPRERLVAAPDGEPSDVIAARVAAARAAAAARWGGNRLSRDASAAALRATCSPRALRTLAATVEGLGLSARGFDRCMRVARTIADLAGEEAIDMDHIEEAAAYRLPDPVMAR